MPNVLIATSRFPNFMIITDLTGAANSSLQTHKLWIFFSSQESTHTKKVTKHPTRRIRAAVKQNWSDVCTMSPSLTYRKTWYSSKAELVG